jgi:predicted ABC-type ATPase
MEQKNTSKPQYRAKGEMTLLVFAGPNGSGKSTATKGVPVAGVYINADDIKKEYGITDIEAAQKAESLREALLAKREAFTFETVLSTPRNLELMKRAKALGYTVHCIYVLTCSADINVARVRARVLYGGHDVPEDKIRSRYAKAVSLVPEVVDVCDQILIYDNTVSPFMIFGKDESGVRICPNEQWDFQRIERLTGLRAE